MVKVSAEKPPRLLVGEDSAVGRARGREGGHHPEITVHLEKRIEVLGAQAYGVQALSAKSFYQSALLYGPCPVAQLLLRLAV